MQIDNINVSYASPTMPTPLVNVFRIIPEFRILRLTFYSMESQPQNSEFLDYLLLICFQTKSKDN